MRAVVQRVTSSSVTVDDRVTGSIDKGLMVLLGVEAEDEQKDLDYMIEKISGLRIFDDEDGVMNLSVLDIGGQVLSISQFTLLGDVRRGKRPSWIRAERPERANELYMRFNEGLRARGIHVEEGVFQAEMSVNIVNDGPVTILLDSRKLF
ncbi:MAG: D-tyrosyl-tRNA(Tyr) deacylase [Firmicutes bacterium]|jgi:D-tyrosyl-tRNA(Tyr) deacylase|nr:D-tyrosyl-tRNA(Tyr) deacylase [Bacillota bacterium]MEE3382915.1 D-aminoacyl-tRNA deacylase [Anaerovoracaceae bacterium]MBQ1431309.1 D-tyrosyl-tRNA(Tyr) deacylase [Bacillota bacterium]MBQ1630299.1 D-tyrosyl-tRNA(Tyr) deacylase [Bacillota bacterium]MBQ1690055.1 D-tyrosyl-tRNA(Tyr) deacylase [Bacillota bacterium]